MQRPDIRASDVLNVNYGTAYDGRVLVCYANTASTVSATVL